MCLRQCVRRYPSTTLRSIPHFAPISPHPHPHPHAAPRYDANVSLPGCDKNMPGSVIAMARLNRPSIMVYGGTIKPGHSVMDGSTLDIVSAFQSFGELGGCCPGCCCRKRFACAQMEVALAVMLLLLLLLQKKVCLLRDGGLVIDLQHAGSTTQTRAIDAGMGLVLNRA